jgi:hypothetical protein
MFRRLRRPGYWIVLFALLSVYFYRQYRHHEGQQRQAAKIRLYRTYGERVLQGLKEGNFTGIQQHFASGREGRISLEDIALFVTTLHLDRGHEARWKELKEGEGKVMMRGDLILEGNVSYPMDMMVVRRGNKILLKKLHVGPQTLQLHPEAFPFGDVPEGNASKK